MRAVGRINKSTVYNWIRKLNEKIRKTAIVDEGNKMLESQPIE